MEGSSRGPEFELSIRINSLGMREREIGPRRAGERRLLVLGDSFTFGAGVEAEQAFPRRLEAELRAAGRENVLVLNGGVPAYGTTQQSAWLERLASRIEPDAVLLAFFLGNDFYDNLGLNTYAVSSGYLVNVETHAQRVQLGARLGIPAGVRVFLRTRLHLYAFSMHAWSRLLAAGGASDAEEGLGIYRDPPDPTTSAAVAATRAALARLADSCRARGIPLGLALLPDARLLALERPVQDIDPGRPVALARAIASALDVPLLDLTPDMDANPLELFFPLDGHYNAAGHALAARSIARALQEGELEHLLAP
jgi:lysophospholipase L1-like esterase